MESASLESYHSRRPERAITDLKEILEIIKTQRYMSLALCKDNIPYLVTVTYVFDFGDYCFYFHCANTGRKIDYIRANPVVYGEILEDDGYLDGECLHAFRTVQFTGEAEIIVDEEIKRRALSMLIEKHESNPEMSKKRFMREGKIEKTAIIRIKVYEFTGKKIKRER
ncbi:MAG: pyridoxamine 5'-phosphate oxidase family protein [Candidatus Odinarchaeum yellowstonii]|uniref:Pyridoxamine 5'-phosphate oxidase family protein n=1 Tax=Odinarchaeota yellowstonii (strain LCB_4) TaxID=1841599 RepID=A0AAF0D1U4_ODILC|nr:MAG: pyridoxamine 5'-phosphate oxidase family protein [Candidatus Odinarchaeum yellowstonii]